MDYDDTPEVPPEFLRAIRAQQGVTRNSGATCGVSYYDVAIVAWESAEAALAAVRLEVFVREQGVPVALEWDGEDARSVHALARAVDGTAIGTGRLLPDGHIGRMAVLAAWRGRGVGSALLATLVAEAARRGHREVALLAQTHAIPFYERHGFTAHGPIVDDAGLPHRAMRRTLGS